jgi:hypothetical protein
VFGIPNHRYYRHHCRGFHDRYGRFHCH